MARHGWDWLDGYKVADRCDRWWAWATHATVQLHSNRRNVDGLPFRWKPAPLISMFCGVAEVVGLAAMDERQNALKGMPTS